MVLFFSKFSTNNALSRSYNVLDIKVEENYDINFDKSQGDLTINRIDKHGPTFDSGLVVGDQILSINNFSLI